MDCRILRNLFWLTVLLSTIPPMPSQQASRFSYRLKRQQLNKWGALVTIQSCDATSMNVLVHFPTPGFNELIFVGTRQPASYRCVFRGNGLSQDFTIPVRSLDECGTREISPGVYESQIAIRGNPDVITEGDYYVTVRCQFGQGSVMSEALNIHPVFNGRLVTAPDFPEENAPVLTFPSWNNGGVYTERTEENQQNQPLKTGYIYLIVFLLLFLLLLLLLCCCAALYFKHRRLRRQRQQKLFGPVATANVTKGSDQYKGFFPSFWWPPKANQVSPGLLEQRDYMVSSVSTNHEQHSVSSDTYPPDSARTSSNGSPPQEANRQQEIAFLEPQASRAHRESASKRIDSLDTETSDNVADIRRVGFVSNSQRRNPVETTHRAPAIPNSGVAKEYATWRQQLKDDKAHSELTETPRMPKPTETNYARINFLQKVQRMLQTHQHPPGNLSSNDKTESHDQLQPIASHNARVHETVGIPGRHNQPVGQAQTNSNQPQLGTTATSSTVKQKASTSKSGHGHAPSRPLIISHPISYLMNTAKQSEPAESDVKSTSKQASLLARELSADDVMEENLIKPVEALEGIGANHLSSAEVKKWRHLVVTDDMFRRQIATAERAEDFDHLRSSAKYGTLFPTDKWELIAWALARKAFKKGLTTAAPKQAAVSDGSNRTGLSQPVHHHHPRYDEVPGDDELPWLPSLNSPNGTEKSSSRQIESVRKEVVQLTVTEHRSVQNTPTKTSANIASAAISSLQKEFNHHVNMHPHSTPLERVSGSFASIGSSVLPQTPPSQSRTGAPARSEPSTPRPETTRDRSNSEIYENPPTLNVYLGNLPDRHSPRSAPGKNADAASSRAYPGTEKEDSSLLSSIFRAVPGLVVSADERQGSWSHSDTNSGKGNAETSVADHYYTSLMRR